MRFIFTCLLFCGSIQFLMGQAFKGLVLDGEHNEPIELAEVYLIDLGLGTHTDSLGHFIFEGTFPEVVKVRINALGYKEFIKEVQLTSDAPYQFKIYHAHYTELNEVVVSTTTGVLQNQSITNVSSKSINELNLIANTSFMDAIASIPGVYNASTGTGVSKPVIRGLSGMRVLTSLNGLRIEDQQWGSHHGMNIGDIGIGRVEVIKGPSSLLYGADALGGVMYFIDESYADANTISVNAGSKLESNGLLTDTDLGLKFSKGNFKLNLHGNYTSAADYQLPNGTYLQNSRFNGAQFKTALGYNYKKWVLNIRYNFQNGKFGVPGHTHDSVYSPDIFKVKQSVRENTIPRMDVLNSFLQVENAIFFKKGDLKFNLGNTINRLQEFEERVTAPSIDKLLTTNQYTIKYHHKLNNKLDVIIGAQGMCQTNSNAENVDEVLIPDATLIDNGVFAVLKGKINTWDFQIGGRYDNRQLETQITADFVTPFKGEYNSVNYSAGFAKTFKKHKLRLNFSSGFRAPHMSELLSDGIHHGSLRYEIGRTDLKNEQANQIDFSYEMNYEHFSLILNPFYNFINNYITINPTDSLVDNYKVYEYNQVDKAELMGVEGGVHYHPHFLHGLHLEADVSYLYAQDKSSNPLALTPQTRLNGVVRYQFDGKKKFKFENIVLQYQYFFEQNRVSSYETVTPDYHLLNLGVHMAWELKTPVHFNYGVKNILNTKYINHLSTLKNIGLEAQGINFYISATIEINHKLKKKKK